MYWSSPHVSHSRDFFCCQEGSDEMWLLRSMVIKPVENTFVIVKPLFCFFICMTNWNWLAHTNFKVDYLCYCIIIRFISVCSRIELVNIYDMYDDSFFGLSTCNIGHPIYGNLVSLKLGTISFLQDIA